MEFLAMRWSVHILLIILSISTSSGCNRSLLLKAVTVKDISCDALLLCILALSNQVFIVIAVF